MVGMKEKCNILDFEVFSDSLIIVYWDNGVHQRLTKREILAIARLGKELFPDELEFRGPEITTKAEDEIARQKLNKKIETNGYFTEKDIREALGIGKADGPFEVKLTITID